MTAPIPSDIRCETCGAREDEHYDGVQCPTGADTWSSTQSFVPSVSPASEKWDVRDGKELIMTTEIPCEWYGRKVGMFHACVDTSDGSLRCINCKNEFHKPLSPASTKEEK